jgi:hypothetical protein
MEQYDWQCAVTGMKYRLDALVETQAAHIIPKKLGRKCYSNSLKVYGQFLVWIITEGLHKLHLNHQLN